VKFLKMDSNFPIQAFTSSNQTEIFKLIETISKVYLSMIILRFSDSTIMLTSNTRTKSLLGQLKLCSAFNREKLVVLEE
jgi:hypothetical protein